MCFVNWSSIITLDLFWKQVFSYNTTEYCKAAAKFDLELNELSDKLTEFNFSELGEGQFSGDHVDAPSRTASRHFDKFFEGQESVAGANVTFNDRFGLNNHKSS